MASVRPKSNIQHLVDRLYSHTIQQVVVISASIGKQPRIVVPIRGVSHTAWASKIELVRLL